MAKTLHQAVSEQLGAQQLEILRLMTELEEAKEQIVKLTTPPKAEADA